MLCILQDIKTRLGLGGVTDTQYDTILNQIISSFDSFADSFTQRTLIDSGSDVTEYFTGAGQYLQLSCYPVVSITSVIESYDYDFTAGTELTANTDYRAMKSGKNGILYRIAGQWIDIPDSVQAVYRGGYCIAGATPGEGEHALPADLREAAIAQCSLIFKRRDDIQLTSHGFEGGSVDMMQSLTLLPLVEQTLKKYRKAFL